MQIAEIIDEGVKSKMAAAGLAGLIAGANLPDAPNDSTFPERMTRSQNVDPNCSGSGCETTAHKVPAENISISTSSPRKVGFGNILELDISLKNRNPYPVKDIKIKCTHRGKSNTVVDTTSTTIYDVIPANGTLSLSDHNMGFMHPQTEYVSCKVIDAIRR